MNCSTPGFPVLHCLLEQAQTHVHWVSDAIQPSHPLAPFSSCPQSFPAFGFLPVSQLFAPGGQSIGASALASVLPENIQGWFPLRLTDLISLQSKELLKVFCTTFQKHRFFDARPSLWSNSHIHTRLLWTFVSKVMSLFFNTLSRFVIAFLPRSKRLLISWLQSPSTMILEPKKIKFVTVSTFPPIYLPWSDGTRCHDLSFLDVAF